MIKNLFQIAHTFHINSRFSFRKYCHLSRFKMRRSYVQEIEDLRRIFAAQFSNVVFQEIRRKEELHKEPIPSGEHKFTVMSYNVLAQDLLEKHPGLYPNHNPDDLRWENRKKRLMDEIVSQNPDILAMQEVQDSHIPLFYNELEKMGYRGVFKRRTGNNTDGVAVYYKTKVFDLLNWTSVEFNQPGIKYLNRPNVGLILRLRVKHGSAEIFLANTHLLYNPKRWEVRLAQTQLLLTELHRISKTSESSYPAVLFMGDLNSKPDSPVVRLLANGTVHVNEQILPSNLGVLNNCTHSGENKLFNSDQLFEKEKENVQETCPNDKTDKTCFFKKDYGVAENVPKLRSDLISHKFNFSSVYDLSDQGKNRGCTTYHDEWVTVDYMFYSNLRLLSRLRLPTVEECANFIKPMPNRLSPSDHFPLLATFSIL